MFSTPGAHRFRPTSAAYGGIAVGYGKLTKTDPAFLAIGGAPVVPRAIRYQAIDGAYRHRPALAISALGPSRGGREQAQGASAVHSLVAAVDAELGVQMVRMGSDGVLREE